MTTKPVYIADVIGQVVDQVITEALGTVKANDLAVNGQSLIQTINYQYGHFRELIQTLAQWDADPNGLRSQKYPLIYLVQDFREQRGKSAGVYADVSLNIIICHQTEGDYKVSERMAKVFKPVLYPIYYSLLNQLSRHPMIFQGESDMIPHDKWDRSFWGTTKLVGSGGTDRSQLADYVDAIDLQNLQLKISFQPCF